MPKNTRKTDGNYAKKSNKKGKRTYSKKTFSKSYLYAAKEPMVEKKDYTINPTAYNCPLTASFGNPVHLTPIPQGPGASERLGRGIRIKSVQIRLNTRATGGAAGQPSQIRYAIVYDRQANGTQPLATDIWSGGQFQSMMNLGQSERYVILIDRITDSQQSSSQPISDKAYVKCDLDQVWSGALGSAANCNTGTIWLFMANNSDIAVGQASVVDYSTRVRYTDC